jgi:hypothetical protein
MAIQNPTQIAKFESEIFSNTQTNLIQITEDKLENITTKFIDKFKKAMEWLTPMSIFLSLLITCLTTEVKNDFLQIPKECWTGIFYTFTFVSFAWLVRSLYYRIKHNDEIKVEKLLYDIKNTKKDIAE